MSFGENLIALRISRGISRKELAEKLDIPYTTLRNYETDQREPGHSLLIQIATIFSVSVDELIGHKNKTAPSLSDEAVKVGAAYDKAQPGVRFSVRKLLELEQPDQPDLSIVARGGITVRGKPDSEIDPKEVERLANKIKDPDEF